MKNHLLFHGTTGVSAENISKYGFKEDVNLIWEDSVPGNAYFYKETIDEDFDGFIKACENAQLACVSSGTMERKCGIVILVVPDEYMCCFWNDESGAGRMENVAVEIDIKSLNKLIREKKIQKYVVYGDIYNPFFRTMYFDLGRSDFYIYAENKFEEQALRAVSLCSDDAVFEFLQDVIYDFWNKEKDWIVSLKENGMNMCQAVG